MWHQMGNWFFKDGEDFWEGMKNRTPTNMRDDEMKAEMIRLFEETKPEMRCFEKLFILVSKE